MFGAKQRCGVCSLPTGTLVLLWIVMIGCSFHMIYLNFNYYQSYEESTSNSTNSTNVNKSDGKFREKRSLIDLPGQMWNNLTNKTGQLAGTLTHTVTSTIDEGRNLAYSARKSFLDEPVQIITNGTRSLIDRPVGDLTRQITFHVVQQLNNSGAINDLSKLLAADMVAEMNGQVIDKRMDDYGNSIRTNLRNFFRNLIRCLIRLWDMFGIGSSVLGIYGIHKNIPKMLKYSVLFFRISTVSQFVIMLVTNVESNVEHTRFLMSELTGIDAVKNWAIFIYFGIYFSMALTACFTIVVKKCQNAILQKESSAKNISSA